MPRRTTPLINNEYYHVYNRGVNKRKIFINSSDYQRVLNTIEYYSFENHGLKYSHFNRLPPKEKGEYLSKLKEKRVDVICFVFMPNHYHFLIKQKSSNGISSFLRLFQNSYTRYFNTKHKRIGPLMQGQFKAIHIDSDEYLLHLSRYIHLNPLSSMVIKTLEELEQYPWSSYPYYLNPEAFKLSKLYSPNIILEEFKNQSYKEFVIGRSDYQQKLEEIKHLLLE